MTAKKKKVASKRKPRPRKPKMIVVTEQPTEIIQRTVTTGGRDKKIWNAVADFRKTVFLGFWMGVGLAPIGSHIVSQFYCGVEGVNQRCHLIEFPAWLEAGGIILALIMANAMRDIVSKSTTQFLDSLKGLPKLLRRSGFTSENKAVGQDK